MADSSQWRTYEAEVHEELTSHYPEATVLHDTRLLGTLSLRRRQIDIMIEEPSPTGPISTIVEAKHHSRPIDVKQVEAFMGLLRDVGVDRGIMISPVGYTRSALDRAFRDDVDLDLDVITLAEFRQWQSSLAIPYAGRNGAVLFAPVGWIIDGERKPQAGLARLYRRGRTAAEAIAASEFMYVQIWDRRPPVTNLDQLLEKQEADIWRHHESAHISYEELYLRQDARICLRRVEIASYPSAELTGFVEFATGILFVVMFTPLVVERRNMRKLTYLMSRCVPVSLTHAA